QFIDEQVEDKILDRAAEYVRTMEKPYIFAFSVLTAGFKNAIAVSKEIKARYPDSVILFGGIHPTAAPDEVIAFDHIDAVIRGEGERPIIEFYRCVKQGKDCTHISGLTFKAGGKIMHNDMSDIIEDLDNYPPFPYHRFTSGKYDLGFVLSSRGCPYRCIFCSNRITTGKKYRYRSAESIVNELEMLNSSYNRRYALFIDDNFLVSKKRTYALMEEIKKRGLHRKMTFNFQARGDNVNYELLRDLYDAGFRSIFFGLETASEELMKTVKKGETVAECVEAVRMSKQIGFHVSATFIYSLPGETHKDRMDCVRLSNELDLDMVRFNNATPYPGTELHDIAVSENRLYIKGLYENFNSVSTFIENPFNKIPFSFVPAGNSEEEIRMDILLSYLVFYLDFRRLKSIFASPDKGVGWFNAGEDLIVFLRKIPALFLMGALLTIKFGELFLNVFLRKKTSISFREISSLFRERRRNRKSVQHIVKGRTV
ncbi:MAG: radical SAM protein, partial [Nitrospirota bacterium]